MARVHLRYYRQSRTYTGSKVVRAYSRRPDGKIQDVGTLDAFTGQVNAAGF
jgi:hypothetical protein